MLFAGTVEESISKAKTAKQSGNVELAADIMKIAIAVHLAHRIIFVETKDIYYLHADNKYTEIHLFDKKYLLSKTLNELEKELDDNFLRLHRSSIINRKHIGEILKLSSRKWIVKLNDKKKTELAISRNYREKLF